VICELVIFLHYSSRCPNPVVYFRGLWHTEHKVILALLFEMFRRTSRSTDKKDLKSSLSILDLPFRTSPIPWSVAHRTLFLLLFLLFEMPFRTSRVASVFSNHFVFCVPQTTEVKNNHSFTKSQITQWNTSQLTQ